MLGTPQCLVRLAQVVEALVHLKLRCVRDTVDAVFLEELQAMVVAAELACVDKGHARHDIGEGCEEVCGSAHALLLGAVPRVLIMVGGEVHADSISTHSGIGFSEVCPEVFHGVLSLRHTVHQVVQLPAVVHIERRLGEFLRLGFILGKGEHIGVVFADVRHRPVPEVGGHLARYVATETVDTDRVHPPAHAAKHLLTHVLVLVVEFGDVRPVVLYHQVTQ